MAIVLAVSVLVFAALLAALAIYSIIKDGDDFGMSLFFGLFFGFMAGCAVAVLMGFAA